MSMSKVLLLGFCMVLVAALMPPNAHADQWNQATKLTFTEPVEVPGVVLPAGTYLFKLMDDDADRNIVQVWSADRTHLLATIFTISDYTAKLPEKPVIRFEERPGNSPEALKAWFYPGDSYGHEFVYPRTRATELAKRTGQSVPSMPNELASNITKPAKSAQEPSVVAMKKAPVKAVSATGKEVEIAKAVIQPRPLTTASKRLPQTASLLPLWATLGLALVAAGLGLRLARNLGSQRV